MNTLQNIEDALIRATFNIENGYNDLNATNTIKSLINDFVAQWDAIDAPEDGMTTEQQNQADALISEYTQKIRNAELADVLKAMADSECNITIKSVVHSDSVDVYIFDFSGNVDGTSICIVSEDDLNIIYTPIDWQTNYGYDGTDATLGELANYQWMSYTIDCGEKDRIDFLYGR